MHHFHPDIKDWFNLHFEAPTLIQQQAWQQIANKKQVLLSAPTGSGKTLAAFLQAINELWQQAENQTLQQQTKVLYISPLKALSNDIQKNLQQPLEQLYLQKNNHQMMHISAQVRTGDTTNYERQKILKNPPHILVTTPESLYLLLTSEKGRDLLSTVESVIVDEIHALIHNKRGAHLTLSLERLERICSKPLQRIGISATQEPLFEVAAFLLGNRPEQQSNLAIIDCGHNRERDLALTLPASNLDAIASAEQFSEIYDELTTLCQAHQTTLIFVNTRRQCERIAKALAERLGENNVAAHHGSLAKEHRLDAEVRLKSGQLRALVTTSALELGIDIGEIDLVCQIGSPNSINALLQRVGRSGHQVKATPKGRLFPLTRTDLVECAALLKAINDKKLDKIQCYPAPLDVLAQQIVAEVAANKEISVAHLWQQVTLAYPYQNLPRSHFNDVLLMLADGFSTARGRRAAYLHFDQVHQVLRPRRGARLTALTNGGTIPDQFDFDVILQPQGFKIGTLNEDFSFESLPGDIFQLGNHCYQIEKVETGKVFVHDANGLPPNIPFWFGEAPSRSDILSQYVSKLRTDFNQQIEHGIPHTEKFFRQHYQLDGNSSRQLCAYLCAAYYTLGCLPTQEQIIIERFFDDADDQHIVLHSCYGSAINKAWGLALRKRFCRQFNFELQAAALEDCIILSLSSTHSFNLDDVAHYLHSQSVENVLTQALLDAPMFPTHWRWNATIALAVKRFQGGKKNPPQFQRSDAEDLIAVVFPDQIACLENIAGERDIPEHPLIQQTLYDCLHSLMNINGLVKILDKIQQQKIVWQGRDLNAPSVLAEEILGARPYAFLDDGNAEERRTALVKTHQQLQPSDYANLAQINSHIIQQISQQVWPQATNADECHDALLLLGLASQDEIEQKNWAFFVRKLIEQQRVTQLSNGFYVCAERLALTLDVYPDTSYKPSIKAIKQHHHEAQLNSTAQLLRLQFQCHCPLTEKQISEKLLLSRPQVHEGCLALQQQGIILECDIDGKSHWCERAILARIRRQSVARKRKQNPIVSIAKFMQFLFHWQGINTKNDPADDSPDALLPILHQLNGYSAQAQSWENAIFPTRLAGYMSYYFDIISQTGDFIWYATQTNANSRQQLTKQSQIRICERQSLDFWRRFENQADRESLSLRAQRAFDVLQQHGAQFFSDIHLHLGGLQHETELALSELVANGYVSSDNFAGLRLLIESQRQREKKKRSRFDRSPTLQRAGRWWLIAEKSNGQNTDWQPVEYITKSLLKRYGIICKSLLTNETALPKWRDMHYVLRRMEARDEVLGGRFIEGICGEHFALPETIAVLRHIDKAQKEKGITINGCDPLNLSATAFLSQRKIAAKSHNKLLIYSGELISANRNGEIKWFCNPNQFSLSQQHQFQQAYIQATRASRHDKPVRYR